MDKNATITIDSDDDAADCSVVLVDEVPAKHELQHGNRTVVDLTDVNHSFASNRDPSPTIPHPTPFSPQAINARSPESKTFPKHQTKSPSPSEASSLFSPVPSATPSPEPCSSPSQSPTRTRQSSPGFNRPSTSSADSSLRQSHASSEGGVSSRTRASPANKRSSTEDRRTCTKKRCSDASRSAVSNLDKKQEREAARRQKELDKEKRKIERQAEVANAACKSLQNCTAVIDNSAVEIIDSERHTFKTLFDESGAQFKVTHTSDVLNSITWKWRRTEVKNGQLVENIDDVKLLMIVMSGSDYLKRLLMCRDDPKNRESLKNFVCDTMRVSGANINLLVYNLSKVLKEAKRNDDNAFRRNFRRTYESDEPSTNADRDEAPLGIGLTDLQDLRLDMQLEIHRDHPGRKFQIEFEEKREEAVHLILRYTKAAARLQIESRKVEDIDVSFPLNAEKEKAFDPTKNLSGLWESQLMQFGQLTRAHAKAIVAQYESPTSLIEGYEGLSPEDGEMLLGDINIGRTQKKVPPTLSRRIYRAMTSRNPDLFLGVD